MVGIARLWRVVLVGLSLLVTFIVAAPAEAASSISCSPATGGVLVGTVVSCSFSGTGFLFWSAPGFQASVSGNSATFTATRSSGPGSITGYWAVPGLGAQSQSFQYTFLRYGCGPAPNGGTICVDPPPVLQPPTASCTPTGGTIRLGSTVTCSFVGAGLMFWSAPGFTPMSSGSANPTFTAAHAGQWSITAHWSVPGLGAQAATFSYQLTP